LRSADGGSRRIPKSSSRRNGYSGPARYSSVDMRGMSLTSDLDDDDAITKVVGANAEAQVRVRERNEEDARGLQLERRNAEDAVAAAERSVFGAQQEFDDALDQKRNHNGAQDAVDKGRTKLEDARKKLADERANLASVNAKSGMPLPTRLEAALTVARAELTGAELGVEHTRIRAPFDGTVLNVIAKEGEVAAPSPENTLVIYGDLSTMKVRAEVEERDAAKIRVGQRVVVRADAYPEQDFEGRIQHWRDGLGLLSTPGEWLLGKGLGRFPKSYFFGAPDAGIPGSYRIIDCSMIRDRIARQGARPLLELGRPAHSRTDRRAERDQGVVARGLQDGVVELPVG